MSFSWVLYKNPPTTPYTKFEQRALSLKRETDEDTPSALRNVRSVNVIFEGTRLFNPFGLLGVPEHQNKKKTNLRLYIYLIV